MRPADPLRFDALVRLLELPDPKDLPRRTHVYRYEGDPDRRGKRLPAILMAWLQRRHLGVNVEEPAPAVQTQALARQGRPSHAGLRVLRRVAAR